MVNTMNTQAMPLRIIGGKRIGIGLTPVHLNRIMALPGTKYSKVDECWTASLTWQSAVMLGALAREIGYKIAPSPELAAWVKEQRKDWDILTELSAKPIADGSPTTFPTAGLFKHQVADINWLTFSGGPPGRLLLNEMGTGKTRSVLHAANALHAFPALVICPKTVAVTGWAAELEEFFPQLKVGVGLGTATARRKVFKAAEDGWLDVVVTGYEVMKLHTRFAPYGSIALKRCAACGGPKGADDEDFVPPERCQTHPKELNAVNWKLIVADEVHRALNATTATRMALAGLVGQAGPTVRRWGMTGTPVSKHAEGLWSLLNFVDREAWPVKVPWVKRYCREGYDNAGFMRVEGFRPETEKELHTTLDAVSRRVIKEQVLDLPPLIRGGSLVHEVSMGTEQGAAYRQMRDELIAKVKEGTVTAQNALVQAGRLTLLASATGMPGTEPGAMELRMPSCKLEELTAMIREEELGSQYALAFSSRRFLRLAVDELVRKELLTVDQVGIIDGGTKDKDRVRAVELFQAGKIPVVAYTHAAGGVGITLHKAETLVLMERSWSPVLMAQSLARVHRAGMPDRPVNVVDVVTIGTIERKQIRRNGEDAELLEEVVQDAERLAKFLAG